MNDAAVFPRGHRFGFLLSVAVIAAACMAIVALRPEMDSNFKGWAVSLISILSLLLGAFWFLFLSRYSWLTRFAGLALIVGAVVGLKTMTRVDGALDGRGLPRIVWKWIPRHEFSAPPQPVVTLQAPSAGSTIPDVPQFFGAQRDGVIRDAHLAHDWAAQPPRQLWRHPVGLGWAAFAVAGGRAFTLEQRGEDELVTCYDVLTGTLVWSHPHSKTRFVEWQGGDGPRSTPTVSGSHVYALGATGILDCLNVADGSLIWTHNILTENQQPNLTWGKSSAPLVFADKVVVTGGAKPGAALIAYQRDTGALLWKAGDDESSYASPILVTLAGRQVILSSNAAGLSAQDPNSGQVLLNYPWGSGKWPKGAQPTVVPGDRVFLSAGYGMGCVMLQIKAGAEGVLTASELWKSLKMKTQFSSVQVRDGHLYGLDDGALACLDIETGQRLWKDGHFGAGQTLLVDDTVLIQSEKGEVILAAAVPDAYHELARLPAALTSKTWNHLVLAGHYLLVRNDQEMAGYELPVAR